MLAWLSSPWPRKLTLLLARICRVSTDTGRHGSRDHKTPLEEPQNARVINRHVASMCKSSVAMQVPMLS